MKRACCRCIIATRRDAQVIDAVNRTAAPRDIVVCAAGGLPGELHKLWRASEPGGYHLEYGFSCMGYEMGGGLGLKMAHPERDVIVMVGDGSYLMLNPELQTSVMLGRKLIVTVPELGGDTPLDARLAEAREAGFTGIEKGNKFPSDPAALKQVLGTTGSTSSPAGTAPNSGPVASSRKSQRCERISNC